MPQSAGSSPTVRPLRSIRMVRAELAALRNLGREGDTPASVAAAGELATLSIGAPSAGMGGGTTGEATTPGKATAGGADPGKEAATRAGKPEGGGAMVGKRVDCLLYTSDAADDMQCVDLG
eukprot:3077093-Rhodomonas_salina.2